MPGDHGVQAARRILCWICQPLIILGGATLIVSQVFVTQMIEKSFQNDPMLRNIGVHAVLDAASQVFPAWLPGLIYAKFVLATLGSLVVVILLALPSANAYFREVPPADRRNVRVSKESVRDRGRRRVRDADGGWGCGRNGKIMGVCQ